MNKVIIILSGPARCMKMMRYDCQTQTLFNIHNSDNNNGSIRSKDCPALLGRRQSGWRLPTQSLPLTETHVARHAD
jgi:hypothetical protein